MRILIQVAVVLFLSSLFFEATAQMNERQIKRNNIRMMTFRGKKRGFPPENRYNQIDITLNALNYYGDLSPKPSKLSTDFGFTKPAVGLSFTQRLGPRFSLRSSFMYGSLQGSDAESANREDTENGLFRYQRNLSFRNRIKELSVVAVFDLYENQHTYISRVRWTPYGYIGASVFHHNPQAKVPERGLNGVPFENAGEWIDLRDLGTEGQYATLQEGDINYGIKPYNNFQIAIPFGVGVRFRLNEIMDLSAEFGIRYTFTDYLDDVSRNYVDLGVFGDNELARSMSYRGYELGSSNTLTYVGRDGQSYTVIKGYGQESRDNMRGNSSDNDIFTVTTIRFSYIIGKTFNRAKFR
ncbi:MAG: DUF6089 family protein [Bacteroidota bacterium]|jgi:hypothetical protein|nr:MAG: hypothetical protein DIU61_04930 [Bacteroidota bacterium]